MRNQIIAAAALLLPAAAMAGGYAVPNTNARDEGMGGAGVANQTGAEAVFGNAAALAGQQGLLVSISGTAILFSSTWSDPLGGQPDASTKSPAALPPNLNVAYGFKLANTPMAVGASFSVPGGGQVYWDSNWPGRANVITVDRRIYAVDVVGAVQPIEQLKISLGGVVWAGTEHLTQALVFNNANDGLVDLGTSGSKLSWTGALELKPFKDVPFRFGFQYRHKADLHLTGFAHFGNVPATFQPQLQDQAASHNLTFPNVVNTGFSYEPTKDLTLNAAISFWRFVVAKEDDFVGTKGVTVKVPLENTNAITWRLGAEYGGLLPQLKLRAGFLRDVTPQPTYTISPGLPESSRWAGQLGLGYEITPGLTANGAIEYALFDQVTTTGNIAFPGQYSTHATVISLGVSYKMQ